MKHIMAIIILPANRKLHTVSLLFTKNICIPRKQRALEDKRFSKVEEMELLFICA